MSIFWGEQSARAPLPGMGVGRSLDMVLLQLVDGTVEAVLSQAVFDPSTLTIDLPPADYLFARIRQSLDRFHATGPRTGLAAVMWFVEALAQARGGHDAVEAALQEATGAPPAETARAATRSERPGARGRRRKRR